MKIYHLGKPEKGAKRIITKFLFFPKRIDDVTRWLEWAVWEQIYSFNGYWDYWQDWGWMDISPEVWYDQIPK